MVEKVENQDTITLLLVANDGAEKEIEISKNAKVSDVIQKYRALIQKDHTWKIKLSKKDNAKVLLKESSTLSECGITEDEEIHVEFQATREKPQDISKRIIHFYIIDGDDKHSRYAYIDNTLKEHLDMYRSNFSIGSDIEIKIYFEGEDTELDQTKSFLQLWIESENTFTIKLIPRTTQI